MNNNFKVMQQLKIIEENTEELEKYYLDLHNIIKENLLIKGVIFDKDKLESINIDIEKINKEIKDIIKYYNNIP